MRLIDADALLKALHNYFDGKVIDEPTYILRDVYCYIGGAPTVTDRTEEVLSLQNTIAKLVDGIAETKKPKGEWINHRNDNGHNIADCSLCGKATQWHDEDEDGVPRYCWYCGAKMRSNENETTFDDYLKEQLKDPEFRKEWENCVTCDHFGKCEGCEKGEEE